MGGTAADGSCLINELSYDIIEVYRALGIYNPKIQIKYNHNTPIAFLNQVLDMIRSGQSSFVFCCEPAMWQAVMSYGATAEEARTFDIRGCYETGVRANEVCTATGYVNPLKAVVLALHDGIDPRTKAQVGVPVGDASSFGCFEEFYEAFLKQYEHLIEQTIRCANAYDVYLGEINPSSMYSATVVTSLERAYDGYGGGVKFNNSAVLNCGLGTAVDALMAVRELVYEKKELSLSAFRDVLDNNWEGHELLRLKALRSTRKYGTNDSVTDDYAKEISSFFCGHVNGRKNGRGGVYKAILHSAMQFVWQGQKTEA
jgi:formate C-acetyltransferase